MTDEYKKSRFGLKAAFFISHSGNKSIDHEPSTMNYSTVTDLAKFRG
jgi:hypothetical protein